MLYHFLLLEEVNFLFYTFVDAWVCYMQLARIVSIGDYEDGKKFIFDNCESTMGMHFLTNLGITFSIHKYSPPTPETIGRISSGEFSANGVTTPPFILQIITLREVNRSLHHTLLRGVLGGFYSHDAREPVSESELYRSIERMWTVNKKPFPILFLDYHDETMMSTSPHFFARNAAVVDKVSSELLETYFKNSDYDSGIFYRPIRMQDSDIFDVIIYELLEAIYEYALSIGLNWRPVNVTKFVNELETIISVAEDIIPGIRQNFDENFCFHWKNSFGEWEYDLIEDRVYLIPNPRSSIVKRLGIKNASRPQKSFVCIVGNGKGWTNFSKNLKAWHLVTLAKIFCIINEDFNPSIMEKIEAAILQAFNKK